MTSSAFQIRLAASRELRILLRSRANIVSAVLLFLVAWLPPALLALRAGRLGLASFPQMTPMAVALSGIVLPLLTIIAGAELVAGELERGVLSQVLTLPISRRALLIGKWLGRGVPFLVFYVAAFGSVTLTVVAVHGTGGLREYLALVISGALLAAVCFGVGTFIGVEGRGRTRALGLALGVWVAFVLALDAIILAMVVAIAPPPPEAVGRGGHTELRPAGHEAAMHHSHEHHDDHAYGSGGDAVQAEQASLPWPAWLMLLDPVDLFRLSIFGSAPSARTQLLLGLRQGTATWLPIGVGWLAWLLLAYGLALRRFNRLEVIASG